jgi:octaheme c-type cytochrome (tetrathionate reductase family)
MSRLWIARALALAAALFTGAVLAGQDHSEFIKGPFKTGPDVTKQCLQCHEKQATDFMKTVHWTWSSRQKAEGKGEVLLGKVNAVNNFCIALPTNEPRCTSCHAGYGWKDASFDFKKAENIDCLVCHDTTGTYKKFPTGAGHPNYEPREFPPKSGKMWQPPDLEKIAKSVGPTSRATCGACHFFGGGGDHVKHGDLDSSMAKPPRTMDVHMAVDGADMTCSTCHRAGDHAIHGKALAVSMSNKVIGSTLDCTDCHAGRAHKANVLLDRHSVNLACQSCHVPTFARTLPTKVWWDWSTAGQDKTPPVDKYGLKTYDRQKGDFVWAKDVVPTYAWFNGKVDRVLLGEKVDPSGVVHLASPMGKRGEAGAKITPFKVMKGKQPIDAGSNVIAVPHLFGKGGYWDVYDWNVAVADGMKAVGLPYSGKLGWAETDMYWKVNHMVVPKQAALGCNDCHGRDQTRMDWKALGYEGDPRALAAKRTASSR